MQILCFEDSLVERLNPITLARPAYGITSASFRLVDWLRRIEGTLCGSVRSYLQSIQRLDYELSGEPNWNDPEGMLLVNARLVPRITTASTLQSLAASDQSAQVIDPEDSGVILAARLTAADLRRCDLHSAEGGASGRSSAAAVSSASSTTVSATAGPFAGAVQPLAESLLAVARTLPEAKPSIAAPGALTAFHWPHEVIAAHMLDMPDSLRWRIEHGNYRQLQDGLFVGPGVKIGEYASIHADQHPILLEQNVSVGPFCFLEGPLHAGAGTRVLEHAAIKDGVSLGHTVKIGGEVEASVIEPYTNKQHHGFLGHSYLGSWINLGAGTCNSDLKNTYGRINIEYGDQKIASGMQFLGCIMGDYSKTAINTGIFTGKVIGVCSMLYGFVTANVPSFVNYARLFGQTSLLPPDIMINSQRRMFARRKVEQRDCDRQLIRDMYERTCEERDASDQLSL